MVDPYDPNNHIPTQTAALDYSFTNSFQFNDLRLQSGPTNGSSANTSFNFDELRMGNTYLDVAPAESPAAAPEPSGKATLLILGGLLTLILARRRLLRRRSSEILPVPPVT